MRDLVVKLVGHFLVRTIRNARPPEAGIVLERLAEGAGRRRPRFRGAERYDKNDSHDQADAIAHTTASVHSGHSVDTRIANRRKAQQGLGLLCFSQLQRPCNCASVAHILPAVCTCVVPLFLETRSWSWLRERFFAS